MFILSGISICGYSLIFCCVLRAGDLDSQEEHAPHFQSTKGARVTVQDAVPSAI